MKPKIPQPKPVVRIPTPDDPDIVAARQQRVFEEDAKKKGRASTSLAGGDASYSRTTLG